EWAVLAHHRLEPDLSSARRRRVQPRLGPFEREDGVEVDPEESRRAILSRLCPATILDVDELGDRGAAVTDDDGRGSTNDVDQTPVQEEEAIDGTLRLALDQQPAAQPGSAPRR